MKCNYLSIILMLSVLSYSYSMEPPKWLEFKYENFGFKIEFPKTPIEQTQSIDVPDGIMKLNMFMADCQKDPYSNNKIYVINYSEFPKSFFNGYSKEDYNTFFFNTIQGMVNNQITKDGVLVDSQIIDFQGCQGREVKIAFNRGLAVSTARFILKGNKMFTLVVGSEIKKIPNPDIQKFFDSFKFL